MGVDAFANVPVAFIAAAGVIYGAFIIIFFNFLEWAEKERGKGKLSEEEAKSYLILRLVLGLFFIGLTWSVGTSISKSIIAIEEIANFSNVPTNTSVPLFPELAIETRRAYGQAVGSFITGVEFCGLFAIFLAFVRIFFSAEDRWRELLPERLRRFGLINRVFRRGGTQRRKEKASNPDKK